MGVSAAVVVVLLVSLLFDDDDPLPTGSSLLSFVAADDAPCRRLMLSMVGMLLAVVVR